MKSDKEIKTMSHLLEMAAGSLSPDEYEKFKTVHDALMLRRSISVKALKDYEIDKKVSCTTCEAYSSDWVYCPVLKQMLDIDGFDETGELHGCNAHQNSGAIGYQ